MGFSEPALYRHFKNKNEILQSLLIYYKTEMEAVIKPVIFNNNSGLNKIKSIIDFQFNHFAKYPAVIMVIFSETSFQNDKKLSEIVKGIIDQKRFMIESIIEFGQSDGSIRKDVDFKQLTTIILGSMRLTVLNWRLSEFNFDLIDQSKELWKTIEKLIKN